MPATNRACDTTHNSGHSLARPSGRCGRRPTRVHSAGRADGRPQVGGRVRAATYRGCCRPSASSTAAARARCSSSAERRQRCSVNGAVSLMVINAASSPQLAATCSSAARHCGSDGSVVTVLVVDDDDGRRQGDWRVRKSTGQSARAAGTRPQQNTQRATGLGTRAHAPRARTWSGPCTPRPRCRTSTRPERSAAVQPKPSQSTKQHGTSAHPSALSQRALVLLRGTPWYSRCIHAVARHRGLCASASSARSACAVS